MSGMLDMHLGAQPPNCIQKYKFYVRMNIIKTQHSGSWFYFRKEGRT
jgi:hypothetical protein